ncbi:Vesicle transport protein S20, partial [Linderina pennispora]
LLLSGAATPSELRKRKARTGNAVLNAATDVTTALQETVSLMNEEIEKSARNITALQDSSDTLRKTKEQHLTLDSVMKTSANLIKSLEQADAMDRWMMLGGLVLFGMVVFNILRKRIWIPGLSTLFSLLRYVLLGGSSKTAGAVTSPMVMATTSSADVMSTTSDALTSVTQALLTTIAAIVAKETLAATTT